MKPKYLLFLFVMLSSNLFFKASAEGVFEVKLLQFVNKRSNTSQHFKQCQTKLFICLAHFQRKVTSSESCVFGNTTLNQNDFYPSLDNYSRHKPVRFFFRQRWKGYFSLIIDVLEEKNSSHTFEISPSTDTLISRAVTSEEMLPNPNSDRWRVATFRNNNLQLLYAFRVLCTEFYFGPHCVTFCRPRNDRFGHFSCSKNGEKLCLPGWTNKTGNPDCTKAVCSSGCNETNGKCIAPNTCRCNYDGWTGPDCSQCKVFPGCINGSCSKPYECKCDYGWGGRYCNRDLHYCTRNKPCYNGGFCRNAGDRSYICDCTPGFTGRNCEVEIDECDPNPCLNGGICVDEKNGYLCLCPDKLSGKNCRNLVVSAPRVNPCLHGGTRHVINFEVVCSCRRGFTGNFCQNQVDVCTNISTCQNGGTCQLWRNNSHACQCVRCSCIDLHTGNLCERVQSVLPKANVGRLTRSNSSTVKVESEILSTGQWIGICVGSVLLVTVLILTTACLIFRRKLIFPSLRKCSTKPEAADKLSSLLKKLPVIESKTELRHIDNRSDSFSVDVAVPDNSPLTERKNFSNVTKINELVNSTRDCTCSCNIELRPTSSEDSTRRLPTYEEACKENESLLHQTKLSSCHHSIDQVSSSTL